MLPDGSTVPMCGSIRALVPPVEDHDRVTFSFGRTMSGVAANELMVGGSPSTTTRTAPLPASAM